MLTLHNEYPRSQLFCLEKFHEGVTPAFADNDRRTVCVTDFGEHGNIPDYIELSTEEGFLRVANNLSARMSLILKTMSYHLILIQLDGNFSTGRT